VLNNRPLILEGRLLGVTLVELSLSSLVGLIGLSIILLNRDVIEPWLICGWQGFLLNFLIFLAHVLWRIDAIVLI
jgi:hypothetical protein